MASLLALYNCWKYKQLNMSILNALTECFGKKNHTCNAYSSLNVYTFSVFAENGILKKSVNTLLEEYKTAINMLNLLKLKAVKQ